MIKMKSIKIFLLALISTIFITTTFAARSYNVPQYDETTENPGTGSGFSAPVTKFDVFSSDDTDEVNYANTKVINITASEEKTFTLDFFTIQWYGSYPTQELVFDIDNKEIADITYYKNQVESGIIDDSNTNKTITDSELPNKLSGSYLNTEYPALEFKLTGLVEGITSLDITVNSTHSYGSETNTSEILTILINVSATQLIDIPNYIYLKLGTDIHSGVSDVKYIENERIGILTDVVSSLKIVLPTEIIDYNSSSTNQILYRIKGDSSIKISGDYISFNNVTSGKTSIFSVEYYILDSNNNEIFLNSYSFSLIFYNNSDIKVGYNYNELPTDDVYEIGTPITVETNSSLKPYIEDLVVARISGDSSYLPYENGYPYVIKEVTEDTYVEIVDKLLYLSGLYGYINVSEPGKYASFSFTTSNVIEKTYPTEISLDSNYSFIIDNSLSQYIDITNISSFSNATTFNVTSYGAINVEFTADRRILLTYNSESSITTTVSCTISIEAILDNNTALTNSISVHLIPINGYKYTFDKLSVSVLVGSSETITLGYLDPTFVEAKDNVVENYYLRTGNAIVSFDDLSGGIDEVFSIKYKITGNKVGYDTAYFVVNGQIIEVSIVINEVKENETVSFELNEGKNLSILTSNEYTVSVPNELAGYLFTFIILDDEIASLNNVKNNRANIIGIKDGTTQVIAYAHVDNIIYSAIINVRVITSIPNVNIVVEKDDSLTSLTKYDTLNVSFDASGFEFSKNTTYKWYLNDELIIENVKSFDRSFNEGLNNLKLIINDIDNNLTIESNQEIMISSVENVQKTISINSNDVIYVDLHQGSFEIEALLDGVVNPNYKYIWSVSNQAICKITINGNEKIVLEPSYVGEVDLTVMTNISKYEEVYIKADIKIIVIEPTYKIEGNNFIKPGSNQTFKLLGDGYEIYNSKPIIKITVDGTEFTDYELNGNEIIINEIPKGKYEISTELNNSKTALKFESTNFNIKEIAKVTIPYLIIICGIVLIIAFAAKKRKTKLERALKKINKLDILITNILSKEECTKKDLKQILKKTNKVKKILVYCVDEGIDELNTLKPNVDTLIKILVSALISDIDNNKVRLIVKNIKARNVSKIINEFMIIKDERDAFESKKKVVDEVVDKKGKKVKVSKEEYELYLAQSKYAEDDEN